MRALPRKSGRNMEKFGGKKLFWFVFLSTQGSQKCLLFWEEEEQGSEDEFFRLRENERSELCSDENSPQAKLGESIDGNRFFAAKNDRDCRSPPQQQCKNHRKLDKTENNEYNHYNCKDGNQYPHPLRHREKAIGASLCADYGEVIPEHRSRTKNSKLRRVLPLSRQRAADLFRNSGGTAQNFLRPEPNTRFGAFFHPQTPKGLL